MPSLKSVKMMLVVATLSATSHAAMGAGGVAAKGAAFVPGQAVFHKAVCGVPTRADAARCHAHVVVDEAGKVRTFATPGGYGPSDLISAYNLPSNSTVGSTMTVAIVDAYGYTNAEADLAVYRSQYGLSACTTANGCFTKVNQDGVQGNYPVDNVGWAQEMALDLDMVSAACPNCKIILVEANSNSYADLAASVNTAAALGANVISNSYGGTESYTAPTYEPYYDHPGIAVTVSTGDAGYGTEFPSTSPHVTAVGGTSLVKDSSTTRGWSETVWSGAGSGCSAYFDKPSWQTDSGCKMRTVADVSAVADPSTGVAVYAPTSTTTSSWLIFGGTSVAAPLIAAVYALNGSTPTFGSDPYSHIDALNDVTSGKNGRCGILGKKYLCHGVTGYDGPSGLGTPNGVSAF